jgi:hypothetical protein
MENFTVLGGRGVTGVPQESHRGILMGLEVWEGDGSRWGYLRKIYPPVYIRAKDPPPHPVALFVRSSTCGVSSACREPLSAKQISACRNKESHGLLRGSLRRKEFVAN